MLKAGSGAAARRSADGEEVFSWDGLALPNPPAGWGYGETRFPYPPDRGLPPANPPAGGGMGKPGFPIARSESLCSRQAPCAGRTPPDAHGPGARASRPRRGFAGRVTAPSPALPHRGKKFGSSPCGGRLGGGLHAANGGHLSRPCGSAAPRRDEHPSWEGVVLPDPPTGRGNGETGFPHAPAGRGRGETRFPHPPLREPMFTLAGLFCSARGGPSRLVSRRIFIPGASCLPWSYLFMMTLRLY